MEAFILIELNCPKEKAILEKFSDINEIKETFFVNGEFDLILKVEIESIEDLTKLYVKKIKNSSIIKNSTTLVVAEPKS